MRKFRVQNIAFHELQKVSVKGFVKSFPQHGFENLYVTTILPTFFSIGHKIRTY